MNHYPLMFTFRDVVSGDGFLAGVTVSGRALMVHEDGKWWAYGVRPAALAESGNTPQEAFASFRNRYRLVLFDIAAEAPNFLAFNQDVDQFYYEKDEDEENRWETAFAAIRTGQVAPEPPFDTLPKEAPETRPTHISVERLDNKSAGRIKPSDNVTDYFAVPMASAA